MPEYRRKFKLTVDGEITVEAASPQEADAKIEYLDAHTLLSHVVIDDPYQDFTVEVETGDDDWSLNDPNFPENDLLPDQDGYGDDYPDRDDYNPKGY